MKYYHAMKRIEMITPTQTFKSCGLRIQWHSNDMLFIYHSLLLNISCYIIYVRVVAIHYYGLILHIHYY